MVYKIKIETLLNGFLVQVGCQTLVFPCIEDLTEALTNYIKDPKGTTKFYMTQSVNAEAMKDDGGVVDTDAAGIPTRPVDYGDRPMPARPGLHVADFYEMTGRPMPQVPAWGQLREALRAAQDDNSGPAHVAVICEGIVAQTEAIERDTDARLDHLSQRFDAVEELSNLRFTGHCDRADHLSQRVDSVTNAADRLNLAVEGLHGAVDQTNGRINGLINEIE